GDVARDSERSQARVRRASAPLPFAAAVQIPPAVARPEDSDARHARTRPITDDGLISVHSERAETEIDCASIPLPIAVAIEVPTAVARPEDPDANRAGAGPIAGDRLISAQTERAEAVVDRAPVPPSIVVRVEVPTPIARPKHSDRVR